MARGDTWSEQEVERIVADYFAMLRAEISGDRLNKAEHRRALKEQLDGRSDGSIEYKHQNISAVLLDRDIPYLRGYKPASNYQRSVLPEAVDAWLAANPDLVALMQQDAARPEVEVPTVKDILAALVDPPAEREPVAQGTGNRGAARVLRPGSILEIERHNRAIGLAGEQFVVNFERARLQRAGRDALADRVEHVSQTIGDGLGYDVRSFNEDGRDRLIEAKTTRNGVYTPFFISANEVRFAEANKGTYQLYRVFDFRDRPKLFRLEGGIRERVALEPASFVARL